MLITMSREIRSHLLESYLPSTLFVIMSWGSFVVIPEVVPGRMVLLVTTLLSLVTMFDTVRCVFISRPSSLPLSIHRKIRRAPAYLAVGNHLDMRVLRLPTQSLSGAPSYVREKNYLWSQIFSLSI